MADRSAIEWTDSTWNPIRARLLNKVGNKVGDKAKGSLGWHCEHVTPGCEHCYAEGFNKRLGTGLLFKPGHRKDVEIFLDDNMLTLPLRLKKPRKIFPGSMTDLFADFVTDAMLDKIFAVMALSPQHTFQVLTKRAERMRSYNADEATPYRIARACLDLAIADKAKWTCDPWPVRSHGAIDNPDDVTMAHWPLPNVWLGVSCENQEQYEARKEHLRATPAAVHFFSMEPLLGPIVADYLGDWVIAGGESGPKARPMHPDWARGLRNQCQAAGVAFHFKQWGEWAPSTPEQANGNPRSGWQANKAHPHVARAAELYPEAGAAFVERLGKKAAGRLLDGVEHNAFPAGRG